MERANQNRPPEMDDLTETQLQELEFQFDENDRDEFEEIASTFGWSPDVVESVWHWFNAGAGEHATESRGNANP